jgi:hypothetical protein
MSHVRGDASVVLEKEELASTARGVEESADVTSNKFH